MHIEGIGCLGEGTGGENEIGDKVVIVIVCCQAEPVEAPFLFFDYFIRFVWRPSTGSG